MNHAYLVVAHRTAKSPALAERLKSILQEDPEARFVLLVPATPPPGWVYDEREVRERAQREAEGAKKVLEDQGVPIEEAKPGDISPLLAIEEELAAHPGYQAIVLSTLPPGLSRWLRLDVHTRAERFGLPVIHVIAH